jgi:predicted ArsR family transcriptional regulator
MTEPDLFAYGYPNSPGYRLTDTSIAAAQSIDNKTLQKLVAAELSKAPGTADEIAGRLGRNILSIRPRLTELKRLGRIVDTGIRRPNASGRSAAVFALAA